uniref:Uncharacterized protein n=1 Tax=Rhizophora mucronata TaxID=61149 RepID=A0A2P2PS73_RHIMU
MFLLAISEFITSHSKLFGP